MDASSSDRSVEVGRTDSVSTLNYRPRASCTGDTACQEGTRRESKQANRYVQVETERIERDLSFDILGYFMERRATFGWDRSIASMLQIASVCRFALQYSYNILKMLLRGTYFVALSIEIYQ